MATGVKPRDEESQITRSDLETIQEAMKNKKFRELLVDYCEEVRDPANQALYQKEMTQLEKERGFDVTFINPKGGYVIKTSVAGDRKAFINICSNENIGKPSCKVQEVEGKKGMNWQLPYSIIPPREDYDHKRERCVIYDVVFHPDTLRMAEVNKQFRDLVNKTAYEGLQNTYNIRFDSNNFRFPKSQYKGMNLPAVIRKEDPNYKPPTEDETDNLSSELLEKLYPQRNYTQSEAPHSQHQTSKLKETPKLPKSKFSHASESGYTIPKYIIKQQKNIDFQDYTYHKDSKQYAAIPSHILVEVNLPLLSSTKDCILDVQEKFLSLKSEKPAKYKLNIALPYPVNDECGSAKFDKSKRLLIVTLPVFKQNLSSHMNAKVDSGVESEENSESHSDDDNRDRKVMELSSTVAEPCSKISDGVNSKTASFFDQTLGYILPAYTHNVLDDIVAFTFHVKNTEYDSVKVEKFDSKVFIKFTSIGSGFVPVHYGAIIKFDKNIKFDNITGEAWDNNVILQIELFGDDAPQRFEIGLNEDSMVSEEFDVSQVTKVSKPVDLKQKDIEATQPVVEVTNLGTETNIVVSSNQNDDDDYDLDEDDINSPVPKEKSIVWTDLGSSDSGAKSILRKPMTMMRSFSESSVGDVASSMDYISSDCIPEEGSLKKTVRFSNVIARQFYRYNSSIEGQKKKNQRKKSKKRTQERRKSESEAEDEVNISSKTSKPRLKSALKQRRDSGLADTSDAETENRNAPDSESYDTDTGTYNDNNANPAIPSMLNIIGSKKDLHETSEPPIWKSDNDEVFKENKAKKHSEPITCDNIKHNTDLYNPDKLNKGQYLEVSFKNDLIFDLDM